MDIDGCTAIGKIVAQYYVLVCSLDLGKCMRCPEVTLHILLHSKQPRILNNSPVNLPKNWNPKQFPPFVGENLKPFVLAPLRYIPVRNMLEDNMVSSSLTMGNAKEPPPPSSENLHESPLIPKN